MMAALSCIALLCLGWAATLLVLLSTLEKLSQARELCQLLMRWRPKASRANSTTPESPKRSRRPRR